MFKRIIAITVIISSFILAIYVPAFSNSSSCYAILDSVSPTTENLSVWMGEQTTVTTQTIDGKTGWVLNASNSSTDSAYLYANISNSFLYRIADYKNVEIEIEYYDSGNGWFRLEYDSRDGIDYKSEYVSLSNTSTWKTYVFKIENAFFSDRLNSADFRISGYASPTLYSRAPVVISNISVRYDGSVSPVKIQADSNKLGNIFFEGETQEINIDFLNKTSSSKSFDIYYTILDYENEIVSIYEDTASVIENGTTSKTLPMSIGKYGVYKLKIVIENESSNIYTEKLISFSYCIRNYNNDNDMGVCTHQYKYQNQLEGIVDLLDKSGTGSIRDEVLWQSYEYPMGTYKMPPAYSSYIDALINREIKPLLILGFGNLFYTPSTRNQPLLSLGEEIEAYSDYVYNLVSELGSKVNMYEIWNEPDQTVGDGVSSPLAYAHMMKSAYTAAKSANPNAQVSAFSIAGVNGSIERLNWTKDVLTALPEGVSDYCDSIALHPYSGDQIPEQQIVNRVQLYKSAFEENNIIDREYWYTEFGWCTSVGSVQPHNSEATEVNQAAQIVREYVLLKAESINNKFWVYGLIDDGLIKNDKEHNYGILKAATNSTPFAAKPSFLAYANLNKKIGNIIDCTEVLKANNNYVYKITNSNNEQVYVMWSTNDSSTAYIDSFSYEKSDFYDMYGNSIDVVTNNNTYKLTKEPVFVVTSDEIRDYPERKIQIHGFSPSGAAGEVVTLTVLKDGEIYGENMWNHIAYVGEGVTEDMGIYKFEIAVDYDSDIYTAYVTFANSSYKEMYQFTSKGNFKVEMELYKNNAIITDLSEVIKDDTLSVSAEFSHISENKEYSLICALYDGNILTGLKVNSGDVVKSNDKAVINFEVPVITDKFDKIILYCWNSFNDLVPISREKVYLK